MNLKRILSTSTVLAIILFFGVELAIMPLNMPFVDDNMPPVCPEPIKLNFENIANLSALDQYDINAFAISSSRWWAGSISMPIWFGLLATSLEVVIKTPSSNPTTNYWYFFGLSCWDDNDSYDQIGFCSKGRPGNKYWSFLVSYSYWVNGQHEIKTSNNLMRLSPDTKYKFTMNIYYSGRVFFKLYKKVGGSWLIKKTVSRDTGGSNFVINDVYWTGYGWYTDFTNYEESHPGNPAPPFDITFEDTKYDGTYFNYWSDWDLHVNGPPGIDVEAVG
jgi:hypothetical protein